MKRALILPAAVLMQTCLGGIYAWSAFVPALRENFAFTAGQTQLVFGLAIAVFTLAMIFAGRLLVRWGPRPVALLGGLLFACGHLMAAASRGRFLWLLGGYGLIGGASIGFGYVAALTTGIQWFPQQKGLVTGVAVAGFGAGAILLSSLATSLLRGGWAVLDIFRTVGWTYGAVVCLAALFLFRPPLADTGGSGLGMDRKLRKDPVFRALVAGMFCGTFAGLMVIGNLKPIGMDGGISPDVAAMAISFLAVGNAIGRIAWGWVSDRLGYLTIPLSLLYMGVVLVLLLLARSVAVAFLAGAFLIGIGFGGCLVLYAAQVAARYGASEVGKVYPLVFLSYGVAGITGPPVGGHLFDLTQSYVSALVVSMVVTAVGLWWTWRVRGPSSHAEPPLARA